MPRKYSITLKNNLKDKIMNALIFQLLLLNKKKNFQIVGSSTVCILSFEQETGILTTANLGDSGYLIVRNGEIIDRSEKQTHKFNIPKVPKSIPKFSTNHFSATCLRPAKSAIYR